MTRSTTNTSLVAFLSAALFLFGVGCLAEAPSDDEDLGVASQAVKISMSKLIGMGYNCWEEGNGYHCRVCREVGTDTYCYDYHCDRQFQCEGGPSYSEGRPSIWFEAEDASRWEPMVVGGSVHASGGGYVTVPASAGVASNLRYSLSLEHDEELYAWARVQVPSPVGPDDVWINMDNAGGWSVQLPTTGSAWQWVPLTDAATGERRSFATSAGEHRFRIYSNPNGVRIDRVLLTHGDLVPYSETFEAEAAIVAGSMVKVVPLATTWANPGYVWVPNGSAANGQTQTTFFVPQPGVYSVWGRVKAPTSADNSFSISTDFSPLLTWSMPVTGNAWAWHLVKAVGASKPHPFELLSSYSTIEFFKREDGTKLDRFLVTNDSGFVPVDAPLVNAAP